MIRTRPPSLDSVTVCSLLKHLYPFKAVDESSVKQLPGYEDRNVYFKGSLEANQDMPNDALKTMITSKPNTSQDYGEFIFKVSHITNSYETLAGVNEVMDHMKCKGFHCSFAIVDRNGEKITMLSENQLVRGDPSVRTGRDAQYPVRVLKYVPGETVQAVQLTPELVYQIGELAGSIDRALMDFSHHDLMHRTFSCPLWDLRNFLQIKTISSSNNTMDDHQKTILKETVFNFQNFVQPLLPSFSEGMLHSDITLQNIVRVQNNGEQCTLGIIDFSDCIVNYHIFELAIAIHSLLSHGSQQIAQMEQVVYSTAPLVAGYMHAFPLSSAELGCLYYVVLARMCVVAVATGMNLEADPTNSYLRELVRQSWRAAELFYKYPKEEVDKLWIDATTID